MAEKRRSSRATSAVCVGGTALCANSRAVDGKPKAGYEVRKAFRAGIVVDWFCGVIFFHVLEDRDPGGHPKSGMRHWKYEIGNTKTEIRNRKSEIRNP